VEGAEVATPQGPAAGDIVVAPGAVDVAGAVPAGPGAVVAVAFAGPVVGVVAVAFAWRLLPPHDISIDAAMSVAVTTTAGRRRLMHQFYALNGAR
jgi:hypothetical protein